jgi:hypothetical protein
MEFEIEQRTGAKYGKPCTDRGNSRNGYRDRLWERRVGSVDLRIPELARGSRKRFRITASSYEFALRPRASGKSRLSWCRTHAVPRTPGTAVRRPYDLVACVRA